MSSSGRWLLDGPSTSRRSTTRLSGLGATTGWLLTPEEREVSLPSMISSGSPGSETLGSRCSTASNGHTAAQPHFATTASTLWSHPSTRLTAKRCAGSEPATRSPCSRSSRVNLAGASSTTPPMTGRLCSGMLAHLHLATSAVDAVARRIDLDVPGRRHPNRDSRRLTRSGPVGPSPNLPARLWQDTPPTWLACSDRSTVYLTK